MLPGFRFLLTATVLTVSLMVFGLGAAALLRASHERFASSALQSTPPAPALTRLADDAPQTLAALRSESPAGESQPSPSPQDSAQEPASARPTASPFPTDKVDSLRPEEAAIPPVEVDSVAVVPVTPVIEPRLDPDVEIKTGVKTEPAVEPPPEPQAEATRAPVSAAAEAEIIAPADIQAATTVAPAPESIAAIATPDPSPAEPNRSDVDNNANIAAALPAQTQPTTPEVTDSPAMFSDAGDAPTPATKPSVEILVDAEPVVHPPIPVNRPADADLTTTQKVAALKQPRVIKISKEIAKPVIVREPRQVRPVMRQVRRVIKQLPRVVKKRRIVERAGPARPRAVRPRSPFEATPFGATPFETTPFGSSPFGLSPFGS